MSYGIFGLIDAIDKFDPGRGFKFETYAIARDQGRHHRRAALDRLGAAVGAGQGARDRAGVLEARERAAAHAPTTARSRPSST